ncbi:MAG TPA: metallophosphoesterase [Candidatus Binatia bacterium]|nr:metallophosphoesterase [Candidatus Binatia bacterium]
MSEATPPRTGGAWIRRSGIFLAAALTLAAGCSSTGRLTGVTQTIAPPPADSIPRSAQRAEGERRLAREAGGAPGTWSLFTGDSLIGFVPGTGDSTRRYLGRLRRGYTADTLNILLCGDNRPAYRTTRLKEDILRVEHIFSLNPLNVVRGLIAIPTVLVRGLVPDLALVRDIPDLARNHPTWGREVAVNKAIGAKLDSLEASGQAVSAIINTGDLVKDGRVPAQWKRFLNLIRPLSSRVPYFGIAGNHERTDTPLGVENWRTATGLPATGDRLYYCFDSADGWVRFLALDSNPMTDPANHWPRDVEIKYSDEQIDWLVARIKEHRGPAFVFMHHPPLSVGFHRVEWQSDAVLQERRERMVRALHENGIGVLATGHEHAYQRALMTWPDGVLINLVTGGAGSPLHDIPSREESARLFSEYKVAGGVIKPENVLTGQFFHFIHVRLWFGGGDFATYEVLPNGNVRLADQVQIDLKRYGVPKIDQHKLPIPAEPKTQPPPLEENPKAKGLTSTTKSDSVSTVSKTIKNTPPPSRAKTPVRPRRTRR